MSHESQDTDNGVDSCCSDDFIERSGLFLFYYCLCFSFPRASSNRQADRHFLSSCTL